MIQFRASGCGYLMVEPRSKKAYFYDGVEIDAKRYNKIIDQAIKTLDNSNLKYLSTSNSEIDGELSESVKTHLIDIFVSEHYNRRNDIHSRYIDKGLSVEDDGITLLSRASKTFFKKNEEHLSKGLLKGTPDLFTGESITNADKIIDIKSSWDIFTFSRAKYSAINKLYYWQLQAYMYLSGASTSSLVYCLIDTPETILNDEKRKLMWKMGVTTEESEEFQQACYELDRLHKYDDIPMSERYFETVIERNDTDIERLLARCQDCIEYMDLTFYKTAKAA